MWIWAVSTRKRRSTYIGASDHSVSAMRYALGLLMPNRWMRLDVGRDETADKNCDNKRRTFVRWRRNSAGRLWSRNDEAAQQRLQPASAFKVGVKSTPESARFAAEAHGVDMAVTCQGSVPFPSSPFVKDRSSVSQRSFIDRSGGTMF